MQEVVVALIVVLALAYLAMGQVGPVTRLRVAVRLERWGGLDWLARPVARFLRRSVGRGSCPSACGSCPAASLSLHKRDLITPLLPGTSVGVAEELPGEIETQSRRGMKERVRATAEEGLGASGRRLSGS